MTSMNWVGGARNRVRRNPTYKQNKQSFNVNHINNKPYHVPTDMKVSYQSRPPRNKQSRHNTNVSQDLVGLQALNHVHNPENSLKTTGNMHKQLTNIDLTKRKPRHSTTSFDIELPVSPVSQPSTLDFLEAASNDTLSFYEGDFPRVSTLKRDTTMNAEFDFTFGSEDNATLEQSYPDPTDIGKGRVFEMMNQAARKSTNYSLSDMVEKPTSKLFQTFDDSSVKSILKPMPSLGTDQSNHVHSDLNSSVPPDPYPYPTLSILKAPVKPKLPNESFHNTTLDTEKPYSVSKFKPETHSHIWDDGPDWYQNRKGQNNSSNNLKENQFPRTKSSITYHKEAPMMSSFNNPLNLQALTSFHKSQTGSNDHSCSSTTSTDNRSTMRQTSTTTSLSGSFNNGGLTPFNTFQYEEDPKLLRTIPNMNGKLHSKHSTVIEDTPTSVSIKKPHPFNSKATPTEDVSSVLSSKGSEKKTLSAFEKMILTLEGEDSSITSTHSTSDPLHCREVTGTTNRKETQARNVKETGGVYSGKDAEWMKFISSDCEINKKNSNTELILNEQQACVPVTHTCTTDNNPDQVEDLLQRPTNDTIITAEDNADRMLTMSTSVEDSLYCNETSVDPTDMYPTDQEIVLSQDEDDLYWTQSLSKRRCITPSQCRVPVLSPCKGGLNISKSNPEVKGVSPSVDAHLIRVDASIKTTSSTNPHNDMPTNSTHHIAQSHSPRVSMMAQPIKSVSDASTQTILEKPPMVDCCIQVAPPTVELCTVNVQTTPLATYCNASSQTNHDTDVIDACTVPATGAGVPACTSCNTSAQNADDVDCGLLEYDSLEKLEIAQKYSNNCTMIVSLAGTRNGEYPSGTRLEKIQILQQENELLLNQLTNDLTYCCLLSKLHQD